MRNVKLLCVGDGAVGKSCLFISYTTRRFPSEYVPTVFDNYAADVMVDGEAVNLYLWDTAGQEDYDRLRPLSYPGTDVFLICFAVNQRCSLENVGEKWVPELHHFAPRVPVVLVACKTDLRDGGEGDPRIITTAEGKAVADKFGYSYYETSALTLDGVVNCFENAIRAALNLAGTKKSKKKGRSVPEPPVMPPAGKAPWVEVETSVFADQLHSLLKTPHHSDVTFVIEGLHHLDAHRTVLCGASSFFARIFGVKAGVKTNQLEDVKHSFTQETLNAGQVEGISAVYDTDRESKSANTTIELSADVKAATFVHVLEFLYTGVPHLPDDFGEDDLSELNRVAGLFGLSPLKTICENIRTDQEFLNPSIGTYLNDVTGQRLKDFLFNKPTGADVVFEIEGGNVFGHKAILSARCGVMAAMFSGRFAESSQEISHIPIVGTARESFLAFLEYLYTDHSPIEDSDALDILALADEYDQSRLVNLCELYVTKEVDRSCSKNIEKAEIDVIGLLNFSDMHNAAQLSKWSLHFISTNYEPFSKRPEWPQLIGENLEHVETERWPPVKYLEEVQAYEKMMSKRGEKCSVM